MKDNNDNIKQLNQRILDTIDPDEPERGIVLSVMVKQAIENDETVEEVRLTQKLMAESTDLLGLVQRTYLFFNVLISLPTNFSNLS